VSDRRAPDNYAKEGAQRHRIRSDASLCEGLEILHARQDMIENVAEVGRIWQHGSVVRSRLLDEIAEALRAAPDLPGTPDYVPDSGGGPLDGS